MSAGPSDIPASVTETRYEKEVGRTPTKPKAEGPIIKRPATYADYLNVPEHQVAELIGDTLYLFPRPATPHARAATNLTSELVRPFVLRKRGRSGWHILVEPELHLVREKPIVPDLAGWLTAEMAEMPEAAYIPNPPQWICEVLSPSTEEHDRHTKMPIYADHDVRWLWLLDPMAPLLEVYKLERRAWSCIAKHASFKRVCVPPFDAVKLDLSALFWPKPSTKSTPKPAPQKKQRPLGNPTKPKRK